MHNLKMKEVDRARMEPDVYSGKNCDKHKPRWIVGIEKEGDQDMGNWLELSAKNFPSGTQIIIKQPVCPKCEEIAENCISFGECDFDWKKWTEEQYS